MTLNLASKARSHFISITDTETAAVITCQAGRGSAGSRGQIFGNHLEHLLWKLDIKPVPGTATLLCRLSMVNCPGPLHPSTPVPGQAAPYRVWLQRPLACDGDGGGMRAGQSLWSINQVYNFQLLPHWCGCQKKSKGAAILFYVLFKYNKNLATYSGLPYLHDQGCFTPPALLNTEHTHC